MSVRLGGGFQRRPRRPPVVLRASTSDPVIDALRRLIARARVVLHPRPDPGRELPPTDAAPRLLPGVDGGS